MRLELKKRYNTIKTIQNNQYYLKNIYHGALKKNTILMESRSGKGLSANVFSLLKELQGAAYSMFQIYLVTDLQYRDIILDRIQKYHINNVTIVNYGSRAYRKLLATAEFLVNDTVFPSWFMKRKDQIYLNTGLGTPVRSIGRDDKEKAYAIGNVQMNLINTDYLVCPSEYTKNVILKAYMLEDIFKGKVLYEGYPGNSIFFDKEHEVELRKELHWEDKMICTYMPDNLTVLSDNQLVVWEETCACAFDELDTLLTEDQIFYVKLPLDRSDMVSFDDYKHIKSLPESYDTYDLLSACDILITDFSSVIFDYVNSRKKIILLDFDTEDQSKKDELYIKKEDVPFPVVSTAQDLYECMQQMKDYDDTDFKNKYCTYDKSISVSNLAKQVFIKEKCCKEVDYKEAGDKENIQSQKERVLIYGGNFKKNGITTSLLNLMSLIDKENTEYYFTFLQDMMKETPLHLNQLPEDTKFLPISGSIENMNWKEFIAFRLYYKYGKDTDRIYKTLLKMYDREYKKRFGSAGFTKLIQFTGYAPNITMLFLTAPTYKMIFAHNQIYEEILEKANQHLPTIRHAYEEFDKVVAVSQSVKESLVRIRENQDNVVVLENAHDDKSVLEKAKGSLSYDEDTRSTASLKELQEVLDSDDLTFITVGRYSAEKGHLKLIAAFTRFHCMHPDSKLIIVGGYGGFYEKTLEAVKNSDCGNDIIMIRSIANPFPILKKCDLFILPSDREALGLVVLEADTLNVPVIATDIPGSGDFIKKHGGYLVPNSENGLLQGMEDYLLGNVHPMNISFEQYNKEIVNKFETYLRGADE